MKVFESEGAELLIKALLSLKSEEECRAFLEDILTASEMLDLSQRIMVAKCLTEGKVYNVITEETGASSATISRVNRSYHYGAEGYRTVFSRLEEKKKQ
jgi:TrpR-related protein YerC/YecD